MSSHQSDPTQPQAAHAQPIDPAAHALEGNQEQPRLQEILPEIQSLAQKVGGMKRLAEIIETLEQSRGS
ncbi:MAG: hypothetical protein L0Z62_14815 [Gemmataceae bacterium]|nr:hypothetical protein [Gemmataceae bacterium]